ncbi:phage terminase small subunit [Acinetobacter guillouiae]|uniref:phage terminase small subunit n=1 Tax=Acinetobacter guillouiae TaxID=106649 RepID=UPI00125055B8|nr:phage terminase small subunit [Acinetobacter guillouiae]
MATNSMREHREKMLAIKAQQQAKSQDPRLKSKSVIMGFDPASPEGDKTVIVPPSPTANIELRLFNHMNQLKENKSIQDRIEMKKQWLPEYLGYIDGCLAVSPSAQNTTLVTLMIWAIDAGEYELAVRIAEYAILNEMVMPEGYSRGIAEFVTEQSASDFIDDSELAVAHAELIKKIIELGVGEQMVDEVRAKIFRALGDALNEAQPVEALIAYKNALRLNSKVGCKKDLTALEKRLNKQTTESSPDATVGSQADTSADQTADASVPASTDFTTAAE